MTVELPRALEDLLRAEIDRGRFPSVDVALAEAVRLLVRERPGLVPAPPGVDPAPVFAGEFADGPGDIVEDAMRRRGRHSRPDVRRVIEEMKELARVNTLGEGLTIREMIEEGRRY